MKSIKTMALNGCSMHHRTERIGWRRQASLGSVPLGNPTVNEGIDQILGATFTPLWQMLLNLGQP